MLVLIIQKVERNLPEFFYINILSCYYIDFSFIPHITCIFIMFFISSPYVWVCMILHNIYIISSCLVFTLHNFKNKALIKKVAQIYNVLHLIIFYFFLINLFHFCTNLVHTVLIVNRDRLYCNPFDSCSISTFYMSASIILQYIRLNQILNKTDNFVLKSINS